MTYRPMQARKAPPAHADDWLMTYADTITLLLCFFAIFVIVSASQKNVEAVKRDVETHASASPPLLTVRVKPLAAPKEIPAKAANVVEGDLPFHDMGVIAQEDAPLPPPVKPVIAARAKPDPSLPLVTVPMPVVVLPVAPARPVLIPVPVVASVPAPVSAPHDQKGDRISRLEMNSAAFFASGSADLSDAGKAILQKLANDLKAPRYAGYKITVEGYTDDQPIHTAAFPSNWELSTARAAAVVRFFIAQGIPAEKLRAAGYGDTFPKAPNRDTAGNPIPTNEALNRRVVIRLEKIETAK